MNEIHLVKFTLNKTSANVFLKNSSWINTSVIFEKGYFQNNCRRNAEQVRSMVRVRIFLARFAT